MDCEDGGIGGNDKTELFDQDKTNIFIKDWNRDFMLKIEKKKIFGFAD